MKKIVMLAAHDDGSGAHVAMSHVRRGVELAAQEKGYDILVVYLNGGSYNEDPESWTRTLWDMGYHSEWPQVKTLDKDPITSFSNAKGVWVRADNILQFAKAKNGSLDVPGTRNMLTRFKTGFEGWQFQIRKINPRDVALAIEMGVPQLSKWAKENDVPSVAVGDTFWSRTLLGSLSGAGEYDEETEEAIHTIAECERHTSEVWLLPVVAPAAYAHFLTEAQIPFRYLPGFFGPHCSPDDMANAKDELGIKSKNLVVMSSGMTEVWETIYQEVGNLVKKSGQGIDFALLYPTRSELVLIDQGQRKTLPQRPSLLPIYANAKLGITRGGVTIIEFISAKIPFLVVQEPNHWLSQQQQAAVTQAGLGHSASLSLLQDETKAIGLIEKHLGSAQPSKKIKARQGFFEFGMEERWAGHLLDSWARW